MADSSTPATSRHELITALLDTPEGWLPGVGKVFHIALDRDERDALVSLLRSETEPHMAEILRDCRRLVEHYTGSTSATDLLKRIDNALKNAAQINGGGGSAEQSCMPGAAGSQSLPVSTNSSAVTETPPRSARECLPGWSSGSVKDG